MVESAFDVSMDVVTEKSDGQQFVYAATVQGFRRPVIAAAHERAVRQGGLKGGNTLW